MNNCLEMDDYSSEDDSPPRFFNPEEDSPFTESEIQMFLLDEHSVKPIFRNPKHLDIDYIGIMPQCVSKCLKTCMIQYVPT